MKTSAKLKKWLEDNAGLKADATDTEVEEATTNALVDEKLTPKQYAELVADEKAQEAERFQATLDGIASGIEKLAQSLTAKAPEKEPEKQPEKPEAEKNAAAAGTIAKAITNIGSESNTDGGTKARVIPAVESYDSTKTAAIYPRKTWKGNGHNFAGQPVNLLGKTLDVPSARDKALAGVWAKFQLMSVTPRIAGSAHRAWDMLSEHEKDLLGYLAEKEQWDDSKDNKQANRMGYPGGIKALIDDSTSGGLEAAPIVFDDQIILTPLLYGELLPLVTQVPLDRGRRIEGVAINSNPTGSWGGVDDTAISLFTTTSMVTAFNTTIYRWEGAIRLGLDFMEDTPIDFGARITELYGMRLLEDLDDVIAVGNGTTQPEGVMTKSGTSSVAFAGAISIGAYETLRFSVAKVEHSGNARNTAVFCGNETNYQRAMAIPVGTGDARRLFSTNNLPNYDGYSFMGRAYKINESMANNQIFYAVLSKYRMYRRKGFTVRTVTEGETLARNNEMAIIVMARYGGQLERGACAGVTTTAPAA